MGFPWGQIVQKGWRRAAYTLFLVGWVAGAGELPWRGLDYPVSFVHLNRGQGLSQGTVNCILQDHQGFLWFGTDRGGLDRYDGHRFTVFRHGSGGPAALGGDTISTLLEDHRGTLWIGQDGGGLARLDPGALAVQPVSQAVGAHATLPDNIRALAEDRDGNLWIGTGTSGLYVIPGNGVRREVPPGLAQGSVSTLFLDHNGTLWAGLGSDGLFRLDPGSSQGPWPFVRQRPDRARSATSAPREVLAMGEDRMGVLWIGARDGLYSLLPDRITFRRHESRPRDPQGLGPGLVRRIYLDRAGTIWVGTDGGGLHRMLPRDRPDAPPRFRRITHDPRDPRSLASNAVESLFEDRSGILWVGTFNTGLNKLVLNDARPAPREDPILRHFGPNAAEAGALGGNLVNAVAEDRFGNLWVGLDGAGVDVARRPERRGDRMTFEHYRAGDASGLRDDAITCAFLSAQGTLWLGTYTGGLVRVDQASCRARPAFRHFRPDPTNAAPEGNFIQAAMEDRAGRIWVAVSNAGVRRFDPATGAFAPLDPRDPPAAWDPREDCSDLVEDGYGTLWIGSRRGLARFDPATRRIQVFGHDAKPGSLGFAAVSRLCAARDGRLFVAGSGGLDMTRIPPPGGPAPVFQHYGARDGLPGGMLQDIQEDANGILWVDGTDALCRFDPATGKARPFIWHPELAGTEFFPRAFHRTRGGEIFFGGSNGLFLFHPDDLTYNASPAPVVVTDFQVFGQSVPLSRLARKDGGITLSPRQYLFSIDFSVLHFVAPEANQYAYMLEGLDRGWNEAGNRHFVTYTTLPPGDYTFRVRARTCDGMDCGQELSLRIHVQRPFWATLWFLLPVGGLLAGLTAFLVRRRVSVLTRINRRLQSLVDARTKELALANQALLDQSLTDALTGLHNRRYLDATIPSICSQALRLFRSAPAGTMDRTVFTLFAMVDLDHFKLVNDTYGHPAGDKVLRQIGEILQTAARSSDTVIRMGGEEFLVIARPTGSAEAQVLPERIREAVEAHPFDIGNGTPVRLTCSIGFCLFPLQAGGKDLLTWEEVLALADQSLYEVKESGRNGWAGLVPGEAGDLVLPAVLPRTLQALVEARLMKVVASPR